MTETAPARTIDAICDQFVEDYCALDPIAATYYGVAGHDDRLPDYSPAGYDARVALVRRAVEAVEAATPVDDREAAARDSFLERHRLELEMEDAGISRCMVSVIDSAIHGMRQVFDLMSTEGTEAHELVDARLAAVPAAVQGYRVTLADEAARGRVSASAQYAKVVDQIRGWTGETGESGDFFAGLVERLRRRPASWPTGCASTPARPPAPSPTSGSSCPTSSSRRAATRRPWVASTTR